MLFRDELTLLVPQHRTALYQDSSYYSAFIFNRNPCALKAIKVAHILKRKIKQHFTEAPSLYWVCWRGVLRRFFVGARFSRARCYAVTMFWLFRRDWICFFVNIFWDILAEILLLYLCTVFFFICLYVVFYDIIFYKVRHKQPLTEHRL